MKKYLYPILLAVLPIMPIVISACSDDDDESEEQNSTCPDDNDDIVVADSSDLKYIITSGSDVMVSGFIGSVNGKQVTDLVIPSQITIGDKTYTVTGIARESFKDCSGLTNVSIPNTVTTIDYDAFKNCSSLTSVVIPNTVTKIGEESFLGCTSADVVVACNSEFVGANAFYDVHSLTVDKQIAGLESEKIGLYAYVDLDLPSGLKWATFNVGATSIFEYGGYYCWGGTKPLCLPDSFTFVADSVFLPTNDAAIANWGSSWRTPTSAEMQELIDGCDWQWTDGFYGTKFAGYLGTSKTNGKQIFFPAAGGCFAGYSGVQYLTEKGYYWTSCLYVKEFIGQYTVSVFEFASDSHAINGESHGSCCVVRPVSD